MKRERDYWKQRDERLITVAELGLNAIVAASLWYIAHIPQMYMNEKPLITAIRVMTVVLFNLLLGIIAILYNSSDLVKKSVETFLSTIWFLSGLFLVIPVVFVLRGVTGVKEFVKHRATYFMKNESRRWSRKDSASQADVLTDAK